ncbi:MAG: hypothetical protein ACSHYF_04460 [Verrucomicrobiaceae bacterium]
MKAISRFGIGQACGAGVLSSFVALGGAGNLWGQEPLVLEKVELLRPVGEACTVTFEAEPGLQLRVWSSGDLECWVFAGGVCEAGEGIYEFVDLGAIELPEQFYRFECFDPVVALPPQLEQLRMELGDEQFAQWLRSNQEQSGTLQGVSSEEVDALDEGSREQFYEQEEALRFWLKDLENEAALVLPELELPPVFEEVRLDWGDYDFAQLLVGNLDDWGNLQGICEPLVVYWEENEPLKLVEFQNEEQVLELWLESYLMELPPIVLENFMEEEPPLPPQLEQLRQELGDEAFAEWLHSNLQQTGNHQGIDESGVPEEGSEAREQFESVESALERWLSEFGDRGGR